VRSTSSGPASMTVCTNDVAFGHLVEDDLPTVVPQAARSPRD
jgi:hypothetical protein